VVLRFQGELYFSGSRLMSLDRSLGTSLKGKTFSYVVITNAKELVTVEHMPVSLLCSCLEKQKFYVSAPLGASLFYYF
jgi:hypothetical protein